jgi:hypothetical protein
MRHSSYLAMALLKSKYSLYTLVSKVILEEGYFEFLEEFY